MEKNALITGTNRGIGKEIVQVFAEKKINIWAHARKKNEEFERNIADLSKKCGVWIKPVYFDMTDTAAMKESVHMIRKEKKRIDILVNNAGIAHGGLFQMTPVNDIRKTFEINFFSMCELTQLVSRIMVHQGQGTIINMASVAGIDLEAGNCAYGASKAAVIALTKVLSAEIAPKGVRVNAVAPSLTDTNMAQLMEKKAGEEMVGETALKRLATTREIANAVAFLAGDEASFITGQVIRVDGGM